MPPAATARPFGQIAFRQTRCSAACVQLPFFMRAAFVHRARDGEQVHLTIQCCSGWVASGCSRQLALKASHS
eukprot:11207177-Lingulodinium_polyedra.AAC.1